ncbi:MAG: diguanylate cyclase response regulator [Myxococcales bacterium]|nr:diguanylate cyclase response regulator [Myxococcales bacterium]
MEVLIADGDEFSRKILKGTVIGWGHEVVTCDDGEEALHALLDPRGPRIAILDWALPGMDGTEVCRLLRQRAEGPYTYIILLADRCQKEDIAFGLESGADDYVVKPFHAVELRARLRAGQRIVNLHAALLEAQDDLRRQATTDTLTGLDNRAAVLKHLDHEIKRARRQDSTLAVMMVDLDHFKQINDTYGHLTGDVVLRQAAEAMRECVRDYEGLGRYGGEEFMVVLSDVNTEGAAVVAERIRDRISELRIELESNLLMVTASIGLVVSPPGAPVNAESLIHAADQALYVAKHRGRNQVQIAPTDTIKHTISPLPVISAA